MFQKYLFNRIKYLILIFLFITFISSVKAIVSPTSNLYVNDYANILSNETEEYIMNKSVALNNVDGTQIVVVTVPNLEGYSIEDYATKLFRNFGIGDKDKNNGLLLLLALEERQFRVEVGYGLEGILPDGKTGRFQDDYIITYLKDDKFDEGVKNGYDAFYAEIVKLNNLDLEYNEATSISSSDSTETIISIVIVLIGIICGAIANEIKNSNFTLGYIVAWSIITGIIYFTINSYIYLMIINIIAFLFMRFSGGGFFGGYSDGGSFGGGNSFRGGSSGGGGSSRGF